eukprot:g5267.t1
MVLSSTSVTGALSTSGAAHRGRDDEAGPDPDAGDGAASSKDDADEKNDDASLDAILSLGSEDGADAGKQGAGKQPGASMFVKESKKKMSGVVGSLRALQAAMIAGLLPGEGAQKGKGDDNIKGIKVCVNLAVLFPDQLPRFNVVTSLSAHMVEGLVSGVKLLVHKALLIVQDKWAAVVEPFDIEIEVAKAKLIRCVADVNWMSSTEGTPLPGVKDDDRHSAFKGGLKKAVARAKAALTELLKIEKWAKLPSTKQTQTDIAEAEKTIKTAQSKRRWAIIKNVMKLPWCLGVFLLQLVGGIIEKIHETLIQFVGRSSPIDGKLDDDLHKHAAPRRRLLGLGSRSRSRNGGLLAEMEADAEVETNVLPPPPANAEQCKKSACWGAQACLAKEGTATTWTNCWHSPRGTKERCENGGKRVWCAEVPAPVNHVQSSAAGKKASYVGDVVFAPVKGTSAKLDETVTVKWHQGKLDKQLKKKGFDFSLASCGSAFYDKVSTAVRSLIARNKDENEEDAAAATDYDDDDGGDDKSGPGGAANKKASAASGGNQDAAEGQLEALESKEKGTGMALGRSASNEGSPCRRLNIYGSVLIDVSLVIKAVTSFHWLKMTILGAEMAGSVMKGVKIVGAAAKVEAFQATKAAYVKCLSNVLVLEEFHVNRKELTTSDYRIKPVLDMLPDEGRLRHGARDTEEKKAAFLTEFDFKLLMSEVKHLHLYEKEENKVIPEAFDKALVSCGWKSQVVPYLYNTAQKAFETYAMIVASEAAQDAANQMSFPGLGLTVAAHVGPIFDAPKCVAYLARRAFLRTIGRSFRKSPCSTPCRVPPPQQHDSGAGTPAADPCPGLLHIAPGAPGRASLPVCMVDETPDAADAAGGAEVRRQQGKCKLCQADGQDCSTGQDCASGECSSKGKCMKIDLRGGASCIRDAQCRSGVCSRNLGFTGACAVVDSEIQCVGAGKGMGGCPCSGDKDCKAKGDVSWSYACLGEVKVAGQQLYAGACVGAPPPEVGAAKAAGAARGST